VARERQPRAPTSSTCLAAANEYDGTVAGAFLATVGAIRALAAVDDNPQLADFADGDGAVVCYIDAEIPKGPPPPPSGTSPPSFHRAVVVVVGDRIVFIAAGYRQALPVQAP
jgi:hypothetical protein